MGQGILTFRIERSCFFRGQFYTATEEPGDHERFPMFPASMLYDVPSHMTVLGDDGDPDVELNAKRKAFFKWCEPIEATSNIDNQFELREVLRIGKENFEKFGGPVDPNAVDPNAPAAGSDGLDALSKTELQVKLDELKVSYTQADSKPVLLAKVREALAAQGA